MANRFNFNRLFTRRERKIPFFPSAKHCFVVAFGISIKKKNNYRNKTSLFFTDKILFYLVTLFLEERKK